MSRATLIPGVMVAGLCAVTLLYSQSNEPKQNAADLLRTFKTIYVQVEDSTRQARDAGRRTTEE